jgi:hypothetical protein
LDRIGSLAAGVAQREFHKLLTVLLSISLVRACSHWIAVDRLPLVFPSEIFMWYCHPLVCPAIQVLADFGENASYCGDMSPRPLDVFRILGTVLKFSATSYLV